MEFIKSVWKNKRIIIQLGKNEFKNRFANTSLGSVWGFLQPFVFLVTYAIVLQFILKTNASGDIPFIVWYLPAMAMWQYINEGILNGTSSIRNYTYLVKKVLFPVDVIPVISLVATAITSIFVFIVAAVICIVFKCIPNVIVMLYFIFAATCFIMAFMRFSSAIATLVPDFGQLLSIVMQVLFWFTPIIWDLNFIADVGNGVLEKIVKCMPFSYIIVGYRQSFIGGNILTQGHGFYTAIFWILTLVMYVWANAIFKKCKKDFADVL